MLLSSGKVKHIALNTVIRQPALISGRRKISYLIHRTNISLHLDNDDAGMSIIIRSLVCLVLSWFSFVMNPLIIEAGPKSSNG